jgi:hypothetical protein
MSRFRNPLRKFLADKNIKRISFDIYTAIKYLSSSDKDSTECFEVIYPMKELSLNFESRSFFKNYFAFILSKHYSFTQQKILAIEDSSSSSDESCNHALNTLSGPIEDSSSSSDESCNHALITLSGESEENDSNMNYISVNEMKKVKISSENIGNVDEVSEVRKCLWKKFPIDLKKS